jgi:single-stranded-DNA-specific exonuclease
MEIRRRPVPDAAAALVAAGVEPLIARIYASRGVVSADELDHALTRLPSWNTFKGIGSAVARLASAIANGERVLIVADYDADGATACAVGMRGLGALGARVDFLVPNRFEFGYGLTPEIVELAARRRPKVIVTVDNGIASVEGVAAARALGIDVVITDHHLPGEALPDTEWIVNPNQPGCAFPSKHLAGVGVMFYLLCALRTSLRDHGHFVGRREPNLAALLDLVALGTVADVVRLDHTNRILVDQGLRRIRAGRAQRGISALFAAAGRDVSLATTYDLGFVVGPRLNAAGRLADMSIGIACLVTDDESTARMLASQLGELNRERREVEAGMQEEALAAMACATDKGACSVCLYRPQWHQGVIGIIASRLKDRFHRPAVVFARAGENELRGSARAIIGFHMRDALDLVAKRAPRTITRFGGHAFAAGLTLPEAALPRFAEEFERVAQERLSPAALQRTLETDGELTTDELTLPFARELMDGVWGQGFPAPVFEGEFSLNDQRVVGERHGRLTLAQGQQRLDAIVFNDIGPFPPRIRAVYRPEAHQFQGLFGLQIVIEAWQPL